METEESDALPVLGVGPIFVLTSLVLTLVGLYVDYRGFLRFGEVSPFILLVPSILSIGLGIYLWVGSFWGADDEGD